MSEMAQIEINLLGRSFTIATPMEEKATLVEAVHLLEDKIAAIQGTGRVIDADKIAIMAALNIAHDLLKTKVGGGLEIAEFQRKIRSMADAADNALGQSQPAIL